MSRRSPRLRPALVRALACAAVLASCRAQPLRTELMSPDAVVLDLPLAHQDELYECGLASISALCQYYHVALPPERRAELAKTALENKGLSGAELRAALESIGMEVYVFAGTLDRTPTGIYAQIDAGRPPLVLLARGGDHHYSLVLGYDEPKANVYLLDPLEGAVLQPIGAFTRAWDAAQRFTLLAVPSAGPEAGK